MMTPQHRPSLRVTAAARTEQGLLLRSEYGSMLLQPVRADIVRVRLDFYKIAACFQIGNDCFSRLIAVHAFIFQAVFVDFRVVSHDVDDR